MYRSLNAGLELKEKTIELIFDFLKNQECCSRAEILAIITGGLLGALVDFFLACELESRSVEEMAKAAQDFLIGEFNLKMRDKNGNR